MVRVDICVLCFYLFVPGQTRPVYVYRLIMEKSVEEKILELQNQKKWLAANVLGENGDIEMNERRNILSFEELASFFK